MHDPLPVRVRQPLGDLHRDAQRLAQRERALLQPVVQGSPTQQLEDEVRAVLGAPDVVQRDDVGMGEARRRLGLSQDPVLARLGAIPPLDGLERDRPSQLAIARLPHHPEPTPANLPHQLEPPDDGACVQRLAPSRVLGLLHGCAHQIGEQRRERSGTYALRLDSEVTLPAGVRGATRGHPNLSACAALRHAAPP